jgi:hypothetical protein
MQLRILAQRHHTTTNAMAMSVMNVTSASNIFVLWNSWLVQRFEICNHRLSLSIRHLCLPGRHGRTRDPVLQDRERVRPRRMRIVEIGRPGRERSGSRAIPSPSIP